MKKYAIIVAGGSGVRMNSNIPKQFLLIKNKPVLFYTLQTFLNAYTDLYIILVLPQEHIAKGQEIIDGFFHTDRITIVAGGPTRFHSVQAGLSLIKDESIIFVHDGVRCLVTAGLIERCHDAAEEHGNAVPAVTSKDSVRFIFDDITEPVDRNNILLIQTPQVFHSAILLAAYRIDYKDKYTDEATVVEAYGINPHIIPGEDNNIKITTPMDLLIAEQLLP